METKGKQLMSQLLPLLLETKYRDTADGNSLATATGRTGSTSLETKYRDTADGNEVKFTSGTCRPMVGNQVPRYSGWKQLNRVVGKVCQLKLETKYRDTADGNIGAQFVESGVSVGWKPSTAIQRMET